jgi:hypothetical protein
MNKIQIPLQLEQAIDTIGLPQVLEHLANICYGKAEHLRENWQDEKSAKLWDKNANQLEKLSPKLYS